MRQIGRLLLLAMASPAAVVGSIACSLIVAVLWGANIGAVYPVVEVVFQEKSLPQWNADAIAEATTRLAAIDRLLAEPILAEPTAATTTPVTAESPTDVTTGPPVAEADSVPAANGPTGNGPTANARTVDGQADAAGPGLFSARPAKPITGSPTSLARQRDTLAQELTIREQVQPLLETYLPRDAWTTLALVVGVLIVATFVKCVFLMISSVLTQYAAGKAVLALRERLFSGVLGWEMRNFDDRDSADLISRINNDTVAITTGISTLLGRTLIEPLKMAVCLAGAAVISWRLLFLSLVVSPVAVWLLVSLTRSIKRSNRKALEESARMLGRLFQAITAIRVVKAYTMEAAERRRFAESSRHYFQKAMRIAVYSGLLRVNTEVLGTVVLSLSMLAGGWLVLGGRTHLWGLRMTERPLELAELLVFYGFLIGSVDPLRKLGDVLGTLQAASAAMDRIDHLAEQVPESAPASTAAPETQTTLDGSVRFEDVRFAYSDGREVLRGLTLDVRPGERVAIVGPNGGGKSTLFWLMLKFYDADGGAIRVGGRELADINVEAVRRHVGIVTQRPYLFDETIADNIRYGRPDATDAEVAEAARLARAEEFIRDKPLGYATRIGEGGVTLTGGQQQRVALARAILRDPAIVLLDEATSQIDPESERAIHHSLQQFLTGRTAIMITHRRSTLALVDRVVVIEAGRVVATGTPDELTATCDTFRRLFPEPALRRIA